MARRKTEEELRSEMEELKQNLGRLRENRFPKNISNRQKILEDVNVALEQAKASYAFFNSLTLELRASLAEVKREFEEVEVMFMHSFAAMEIYEVQLKDMRSTLELSIAERKRKTKVDARRGNMKGLILIDVEKEEFIEDIAKKLFVFYFREIEERFDWVRFCSEFAIKKGVAKLRKTMLKYDVFKMGKEDYETLNFLLENTDEFDRMRVKYFKFAALRSFLRMLKPWFLMIQEQYQLMELMALTEQDRIINLEKVRRMNDRMKALILTRNSMEERLELASKTSTTLKIPFEMLQDIATKMTKANIEMRKCM
eukprot:TRINITY_DN5099_c0_g2_i5.p1 TRINITY_DN5099_c0_g2~~TRINITY_DN5099_c0_g2_i5.p1  ORF type:complete len:312 (+),score=87.51 TRINITY_DN5099_c0_g2_i5:140-1075(+)